MHRCAFDIVFLELAHSKARVDAGFLVMGVNPRLCMLPNEMITGSPDVAEMTALLRRINRHGNVLGCAILCDIVTAVCL